MGCRMEIVACAFPVMLNEKHSWQLLSGFLDVFAPKELLPGVSYFRLTSFSYLHQGLTLLASRICHERVEIITDDDLPHIVNNVLAAHDEKQCWQMPVLAVLSMENL